MTALLPRVLIVAEHASAAFGGEAILPWHYFRVLRARGAEVHLVVHARTRRELQQAFPGESRIHYVEDTAFHRAMCRLGGWLPARLDYITTGYALRFSSQRRQRRLVKRLVAEFGIDVVHQPIPVSPREPSLIHGVGAAVVIGPMNGGMDFPPAFSHRQPFWVTWPVAAGRAASRLLNRLMPGKLRAEVLVVANARTARALPRGARGRVYELVENGVEPERWPAPAAPRSGTVRFLFVGRLVDWKAVDLLLEAFRRIATAAPVSLTVVGDGIERERLERCCRDTGLWADADAGAGRVYFAGWQTQPACARFLARCDVLVLPSLMECGGAVVLEAMAAGKPVIATRWGGPSDYLDTACGVLVEPSGRDQFIAGLAAAMLDLAHSEALRADLGAAGLRKVRAQFDWERKVDRMLDIYHDAIALRRAGATPEKR